MFISKLVFKLSNSLPIEYLGVVKSSAITNDFNPSDILNKLETNLPKTIENVEKDMHKTNYIKDEPNRLYSIITTKENISRVKKWCLEYGIDSDKVNTHDEFLKKCKNFGMFNKNNNFRK